MAEEKKEKCFCGQEFSENGIILEVGKLLVSIRKADSDDNPTLLFINEPFKVCCIECMINGIRIGAEKYYTLKKKKK